MFVDKADLTKMLSQGALELGVELDPVALGRFSTYLAELKAWSTRMNLTTITEDREVVIRHFLDSLTPYRHLKEIGCKSLVDIGAGAGFPGIPLKIAIPPLDLLLIDSVTKKVHFMRHIIRTLGIKSPGARAVAARGEDPAVVEEFGGVDCVISRAFASLEDFLAMAGPYCSKEGRLIAMKGPGAKEELAGMSLPPGMPPPADHRRKGTLQRQNHHHHKLHPPQGGVKLRTVALAGRP